MHTQNYIYQHGSQKLHGFLAHKSSADSPSPAVLIAHDWSGRSSLFCDQAKLLAEMGYVGFAMDLYGDGLLGNTTEEKSALMNPLVSDRALLRDRLHAAYDAVIAMPEVDKTRVAVMGLCFGGLCALDLARSGADIKGAVSFHGLLGKPTQLRPEVIKAKILVLHGYNDPMVRPEQVNEFCQEMTDAHVDWQVQMYGHVQHGFANPQAHDLAAGIVYNESAARRSWRAMSDFLHEIFSS